MKKLIVFLGIFMCLFSLLSAQIIYKTAAEVTVGSGNPKVSNSNEWYSFLVADVPADRAQYGNSNGIWLNGTDYKFELYGLSVVVDASTLSSRGHISMISEGTEIGPSSSWHQSTSYPNLPLIYGPSFTDWAGKTAIAGFKVYTNSGERYGWIRFEVASDGSYVKLIDLAYNATKDATINAGQKWPVSADENLSKPIKFELSQNFPNPFNPTTTIEYSVAKEGLINISVFNILGQKVAELINEVKSVGNYKINFNASNLTSGVYYYKLTAGNYTIAKKMQLIK